VKCLAPTLLVALAGCVGDESASTGSSAALFPSEWKNPFVTLRIASMEMPATISLTAGGTRRKLSIQRDGVTIEEEVYGVTTEEITLVQLGTAESFSPPIPLLRFPVAIGKSLDWKGQLLLSDREFFGTAKIVSERTMADMPNGSFETVLVTVDLSIDTGDQGAKRKLRIWFADGEGPIKRDFGNQVREPRAPQ